MFANRVVTRFFDHPNLIFFRLAFILSADFFSLCSIGKDSSFQVNGPEEGSNIQDTVFIRKGRYMLSKNTLITIPSDTFYIVHQKKSNRHKPGSYENSQIFYDTVYRKFSRKKITQLLYYLAFVVPKQSDLPDSLQVLKSAIPFEKFHGKVIRNITIKILPPFGASIYDTGRYMVTGIGKALNGMHMNTRRHVIRKNLLFKKGDRLNPSLLADNERLLRDLSSIDNARFIVVQTGPDSDSIDLTVVSKDVWSIGLDLPLITTQQVRVRLYDANFLGLGDKLTTTMSVGLLRVPFFMFEGLSYTYSNINGSLINATIGYGADITGSRNLIFRFDRSFLTNLTKWAGGVYALWEKDVNEPGNMNKITANLNKEGLWLGRAFLLQGQKEISRAVITAAVYRRYYTSRPVVMIDSNSSYYNQLQILMAYSFSRNNYYLTDYIRDFGKTENLPYGHLWQLTIGADQNDFNTRIYSGIHLSAGNFFNKFGYISAYIKFGGYFNHSSFEDAVVKFNLQYFTPLFKTPDKRYKFRVFLSADHRYAFNLRSNNRDYYNANLDFKIEKVNNADYFYGVSVISGRLASVCFTPWYFYGFRFAVMMNLQAGLVAHKMEPLYNAPLFSSIGLSMIIKNDNLIFPAFMVSGYFYPSSAGDFSPLQFMLSSNLHVQYYDFNVTAPHEENIGN